MNEKSELIPLVRLPELPAGMNPERLFSFRTNCLVRVMIGDIEVAVIHKFAVDAAQRHGPSLP